jgi:hypothetical protein
MNNLVENQNTNAFNFMAWASFVVASVGTLLGISYLPVDIWMKAFLGMGYVFTVTSCFTLAKTIRDKQESDKLIHKIEKAKTEKLLSEFEKTH